MLPSRTLRVSYKHIIELIYWTNYLLWKVLRVEARPVIEAPSPPSSSLHTHEPTIGTISEIHLYIFAVHDEIMKVLQSERHCQIYGVTLANTNCINYYSKRCIVGLNRQSFVMLTYTLIAHKSTTQSHFWGESYSLVFVDIHTKLQKSMCYLLECASSTSPSMAFTAAPVPKCSMVSHKLHNMPSCLIRRPWTPLYIFICCLIPVFESTCKPSTFLCEDCMFSPCLPVLWLPPTVQRL